MVLQEIRPPCRRGCLLVSGPLVAPSIKPRISGDGKTYWVIAASRTTPFETCRGQDCAGVQCHPSHPLLRHRDRYLARIHTREARNLR